MFLRHLTHNVLGVASIIPAAIFAGGDPNTNYIDKYAYATDTITHPTVLSQAKYNLAGTGNSTTGIFSRGYSTSTSDKYTYAGDICVSSTAMVLYGFRSAFSNPTIGFFTGGETDAGVFQDATDKYAYASSVITSGTILGISKSHAAATGNTVFGLIAGGSGASNAVYNTTKKYTFSGEVVTSGTNLNNPKFGGAAVTDGITGIITGGVDNTFTIIKNTDKYLLASDAVSAGTVLIDAIYLYAGASNKTVGIFGGGETTRNNSATSINRTEKYTFAGDVVTTGTSLGQARNALAAVSSDPGYL